MAKFVARSSSKTGRRKFLWTCLLLQFARFQIPKKPVRIKVTEPLSSNGVIVQKEFILFERKKRCWALSRKCTHLGCTLNYHEAEDMLECPCHQSRFQISSGKVIKGPAKRPLPLFLVEKSATDGSYVVTING